MKVLQERAEALNDAAEGEGAAAGETVLNGVPAEKSD